MTANASLIWVMGLLIIFSGCATPIYEGLAKVTTGMDKTQVIDQVGTPKRTQRLHDSDVWTYVYYIGDRHFERDVKFESGHVVQVSSSREVHEDPAKGDLVIKDYEKLVNEKSTSKDSETSEKK